MKTQFQNGDLVFVSTPDDELMDAISDVTQTSGKNTYSHVVLIETDGLSVWVLHAAPENGVERISWSEFYKQAQADKSDLTLYRLKQHISVDYMNVIHRAKTMLGCPYNFPYIQSNTAFYCSDFVYQAFSEYNIFKLEPMTFKIENSDSFHPTWVAYYKELNIAIPEGLPGCNPNNMATSDKLERISDI